MTVLREQCCVQAERKATSSTGIIDSQSVKTTERGGLRGFDRDKKVNGRKRHILVDTTGLVLSVTIHEKTIPLSIQSRPIAQLSFIPSRWTSKGTAKRDASVETRLPGNQACPKRTFVEPLPEVAARSAQQTKQLRAALKLFAVALSQRPRGVPIFFWMTPFFARNGSIDASWYNLFHEKLF